MSQGSAGEEGGWPAPPTPLQSRLRVWEELDAGPTGSWPWWGPQAARQGPSVSGVPALLLAWEGGAAMWGAPLLFLPSPPSPLPLLPTAPASQSRGALLFLSTAKSLPARCSGASRAGPGCAPLPAPGPGQVLGACKERPNCKGQRVLLCHLPPSGHNAAATKPW